MGSKWTTSALSTLAALQLVALIWFGCNYVSRYYTIWFITFVKAFWTCLFLIGDRMFAYIPFLHAPPDLYYDLKENPWLTSLVVYFVLPWVAGVTEDRLGNLRDYDEREESWWRWWTLLVVVEVALAAATTDAIVSMIVERRDQIRSVSSIDCDTRGDECELSKTDDDSYTPTKSPDDREGETSMEENNTTASARFDAPSTFA